MPRGLRPQTFAAGRERELGETLRPLFFLAPGRTCKGSPWGARLSSFHSAGIEKGLTCFFALPRGPVLRLSQRAASAGFGGKLRPPNLFGPSGALARGFWARGCLIFTGLAANICVRKPALSPLETDGLAFSSEVAKGPRGLRARSWGEN